ncbi:hypothetical protein CRUP_010686 [Coryphaenoides rupestris]|nr:hypothetical protein CRUP_010686 [Coryphaenoides rupestris]
MADREAAAAASPSPVPLEVRARLAELELELSEEMSATDQRKGALSVAENGGSLRRSCEFGSDMLWPPPLESDGLSPLCSDSSSGSEEEEEEEEGGPGDDMSGMEHWLTRPAQLGPAHLGSTSSSSSSTQSGGSGNAGRLADSLAHAHISHPHLSHTHLSHPHLSHTHLSHSHLSQSLHQQSHLSQSHHGIGHLSLKRKGALSVAENGGSLRRSCEFGSDMLWPPPLESDERHHMANMGTIARNTQKYGNAERMETGDVQQPDPKMPRPEGAEMMPVRGEALGVVTNWPPSLEAALQRWGTISPKAPCLTSLDTAGKPLYVLTYGKLWSRSIKLAYNILHKLGSKQEPMVRPGDRVALVFPNNDPVAFMVAFYGCLLAEVVPVPIEVPLTRKDAGSQQIGFLLGSCGVTVALTSDACHKGLPKSATGEIPQFKGEDTSQPPGRGVLSMQGLSHGVVRVDTEERLSVLTVQDVGTVTPGALVCVVKPEGVPLLCRTDEIGELCVCSIASGTSYYGLTGMTKNTFEVYPVSASGGLVSEYAFVRTGLLGFVGPGGLVFISGKMDGLIMVSGRRHNADDIVATALAVEPMKFVYRGRIAVFSVTVLRDERIVVVAEQRPDSTEEDSFQWMSRVLQVIDYATHNATAPTVEI